MHGHGSEQIRTKTTLQNEPRSKQNITNTTFFSVSVLEEGAQTNDFFNLGK